MTSSTEREANAAAADEAWRDYRRLHERYARVGLLAPQPRYYAALLVLVSTIMIGLVAIMIHTESLGVRILLASGLAFMTGQVFFAAHDVAHGQASPSVRHNEWLSVLLWNGVLGFSSRWWQGRHNRHHRDPNRLGVDPDVELPLVFYDARQAQGARRWRRAAARFQAWFLWIRCLEKVFGSVAAGGAVVRGANPLELSLFALHWAAVALLLWGLDNLAHAAVVLIVHELLAGLYISSVNALNHKGMPYLDFEEQVGFLTHQLSTTRDIRSTWLVDLWCGGLNRQIEHHLFPRMPRRNLAGARDDLRALAARHNLPYEEVGLARAYADLLRQVARVGRAVGSGRVEDEAPVLRSWSISAKG